MKKLQSGRVFGALLVMSGAVGLAFADQTKEIDGRLTGMYWVPNEKVFFRPAPGAGSRMVAEHIYVWGSGHNLAIADAGWTLAFERFSEGPEYIHKTTTLKSGPGTLELEPLLWGYGGSAAGPVLGLIEGPLVLRGYAATHAPASLAEAYFHVDASDAASLETTYENGTNYVLRWNDTAGRNRFAAVEEGHARPYLVEGAQCGRSIVDFGSLSAELLGLSGYGAMLRWNAKCSTIRDAYIVFCDNPPVPTSVGSQALLGDDWCHHFVREKVNGAILSSNASADIVGGDNRTMVDGYWQNLRGYVPKMGFHVVRIGPKDGAALVANAFAAEREILFGGLKLAEVVVFERALTFAEATELTEHLMRKWLSFSAMHLTTGGNGTDMSITVPDGECAHVGRLTVRGTVTKRGGGTLLADVIEIEDEKKLVIEGGSLGLAGTGAGRLPPMEATGSVGYYVAPGAKLSASGVMATGTVTKTGSGDLRMAVLGTGVSDVQVRAGSLVLAEDARLLNAYLHVDPSDAAHRKLADVGGKRKFTRLYNVNPAVSGNGFMAYAAETDNSTAPYVADEKLNGLEVADFGEMKVGTGAGYGGYLRWGRDLGYTERLKEANYQIREVHMVFADNLPLPSDGIGAFPIGYVDSNVSHFFRGANRLLVSGSASEAVRNGRVWIDGVERPTLEAEVTDGFHAIRCQTTGYAYGNNFGRDRDERRGGMRMGEAMVFTRELTEDEGQLAMNYLNRKWFNRVPYVRSRTFDALRLGRDAALTFEHMDVATGLLEVGGRIKADSLTLQPEAEVIVAATGQALPDCRVDGTLALGETGTLVLDGTERLRLKGAKTFVVLKAAQVADPRDLPGWTVTGPLADSCLGRLKLTSQGLEVTLSGKGMTVILK